MKFDNGQRPEISGVPSVSSEMVSGGELNQLQSVALGPFGTAGAGDFDFHTYWLMFLKHRKLIASIVAVFVVLTFIGTLTITPLYRATAVIQIERHSTRLTQQSGVETGEEVGMGDAEFYQTQYELLQSRSLAEQVAVRLGLLDDPRFVPAPTQGLFQSIRSVFLGRPSFEVDALTRRRAAVAKFTSNLRVEPKRGSRLIQVHYFDPDPGMAQLVVNGVAETFTTQNLERRFEASSYARSYLDDRLQELKARLEASQAEFVAYGEREGFVSPGEKQLSLASLNLEATNTSLGNARAERTKLEQLWAMAQTDNAYGLPQILDNRAVQANREKRANLAADYQQKLMLFKPGYPEMLAIKSQIDELDRQVSKIVNIVKDSIRTQYLSAKNQEAELEKQLSERKADLMNERARSIKYDMMQREIETNRVLYEQMLQRAKEISVLGALGTNNISIVDPAERPASAYSPHLMLNLIIASIAGFFCGVGVVLAIEYIDNTVKSPQDVETYFRLPVLGLLPFVENESGIIAALEDQRSHISEAFQSLKTALQFTTPSGLPKSLAITSARPGEGKSTTSLALARSCADQGIRVLLIDADLRKPSLHERLELSTSVGLSNYLAGTMQASEVVQRTDLDRLFFIASGPLPPNPADLFAGPKFSSLLTLGGEFFDVIIVDAPPVLALADAPLIANAVSETILVVSARQSRREIIRVALKRLNMARAHVLGVVLNRFRFEHAGYGDGYGYEYDGYGDASGESESPLELPKKSRPAVVES